MGSNISKKLLFFVFCLIIAICIGLIAYFGSRENIPNSSGDFSSDSDFETTSSSDSAGYSSGSELSNDSYKENNSTSKTASEPHVHDYVIVSNTSPTCTDSGNTVYKCECGDVYIDYIAATGHNYGAIDENDYICTYKCSRCESVTRKSTFSTEALKAKLDNSLKEEIAEAYNTVQASLENAATENYEDFETAYNGYISLILKAEQNYRTLYALAAVDSKFDSALNAAEILRAKYLKNSADLFYEINESVFSSDFYSEQNGWDKKAKSEALKLYELYNNAKYLEVCRNADEITKSINALAFGNKTNELYFKRVENDKKSGTFFDFNENEFISYAYNVRHARDYKPVETRKIKTYIKKYIVPLFADLYATYMANGKEHSILKTSFYDSPSYSRAFCEYLNKLDGICGGNYYSQINLAFKNGNILTGDGFGAFTLKIDNNTAVNYFGKDNCNVFSLAHEAGHAFCNDGLFCGLPLDVAETAATFNEACFLAYITSDDCTVFSDDEKQAIENQKLLSFASVIISAAVVDDFECAVYSNYYKNGFKNGIDYANYGLLFEQILKDYGVYGYISENYWQNAVLSDGFYYFSYAISSLTALNEYYLAKSVGYGEALTRYGNFLAKINGSCGNELSGVKACANYFKNGRFKIYYKGAIDSVGMYSPFDESFYAVFQCND